MSDTMNQSRAYGTATTIEVGAKVRVYGHQIGRVIEITRASRLIVRLECGAVHSLRAIDCSPISAPRILQRRK